MAIELDFFRGAKGMDNEADPIRDWIFREMELAGVTIQEVSKIAKIHATTLSKFKTGKQGMNSRLLWQVILAVGELAPLGSCRVIARAIDGGEVTKPTLGEVIDRASREELENAMIIIVKKLFNK